MNRKILITNIMKNLYFFLLAVCLIGVAYACKGNEKKREEQQSLEIELSLKKDSEIEEVNLETEECVNPCNNIIGQWKLVEVSILKNIFDNPDKKIIDYSDENIIYDFQFLSDRMHDYKGLNIYKITEGTLVITGTVVDDIHNLQEGTYSYKYSCRIYYGEIYEDKDNNPNALIMIDDWRNLNINNQSYGTSVYISILNDTMRMGKGQEGDGFRGKTFIKLND